MATKKRGGAHHRSGAAHHKKAGARNPAHHKARRGRPRFRNPFGFGGGTAGEVGNFVVASFADGIGKPLLTQFVGQYLPFGAYNGPAITALTGLAMSWVLNVFTPTKRFARPALIVGLTAAVIELLNPIVRNFLGASAPSPLLSGPRARRGMRDLVTLPAGNFDPYYGTTPALSGSTVAASPAPSGGGSQAAVLKGLLTMPRNSFGANYYANYGR